jgi:hypothetical protein
MKEWRGSGERVGEKRNGERVWTKKGVERERERERA